ncbi:hypothetical protein JHK85_052485 [Glycine max]|nr:hypothetical protein JHK85_052485 [Glycine max]
MGTQRGIALLSFTFFLLLSSANALLSPKGVNFEVQALMGIKDSLEDPHGVLDNWDGDAVDPCSWTMVTCSSENLVIGLGTPSQSLSGTLSPSIGNLTNLQIVLLQNNNISGPIPSELGKLSKLQTLDLSNNFFSGGIPPSLGHLRSLQYLIIGNPLVCATGKEPNCHGMTLMPMSMNLNNTEDALQSGRPKTHKMAIAFGLSLGCLCLIVLGFGLVLWWRHKHNQQAFFDVKDRHHEEVYLGNLKRFQFRELQIATNNFSSKNILGKGGFGNVYKGVFPDGTLVAVKRLKDGNAIGGEIQFQTEVEMISLAVHRNLLRLYGFCMTPTERLLVYPYMSNGSVASRLKGQRALEFGKSANNKGAMLDWVKKIHQEKKLDMLVDKDLKNNYDRIELEEMVQVALLCTQYLPGHRPKMSEVVRMLEGDGLAEKWEASQRVDTTKCKPQESSSSDRYSDLTDDSLLLVQAMELSGPRANTMTVPQQAITSPDDMFLTLEEEC